MSRRVLLSFLIAVLTLVGTLSPATAQTAIPGESVVRQLYAAFNAGNVEGAVALVTDDVEILAGIEGGTLVRLSGKDAFRALVREVVATHPTYELAGFQQTENGQATVYAWRVQNDVTRQLNLGFLVGGGAVTLADGKINGFVSILSAESAAKLPEPGAITDSLRAGGQDGRFAYYMIDYAGNGKAATINLNVANADRQLLSSGKVGFNVYGPTQGKRYATSGAQPGLTPNISGNLISQERGTYVVQVYNYSDQDISYSIWAVPGK